MADRHAAPGRATRRGTWLSSFQERPDAAIRLFCFPHSGGGAAAFRDWPASLGPAVDVVAVELPGRGTRLLEPCRNDLASMAGEIAAEIGSLARLPYAVFGHSVGTLVAFEVTRELRRRGCALPSVMVVSGGRAPNASSRPLLQPGISDDEIVRMIVGMGGVPPELEDDADDLLRLFIPALRADLEILDGYVYREEDPLPVPVVLFAGMLDDVVEFEAMEPWADLTSAGTSLAMFPGDHFYLAKESKQQVLASLARHLGPLHATSRTTSSKETS
jgi:medium-chain acyl-[acyl-carrier-protein] hydrolase